VTLRNVLIGAGVLLVLVVMLFLAVLAGIFIGRGSEEEITKQEPTKEELKPEFAEKQEDKKKAPKSEAKTEAMQVEVGVGQTAELSDRTLIVNDVQRGYIAPNSFSRPGSGNEFVSVNLTLTNTGTEPINVNPLDFKAEDSSGVRRNPEIVVDLPGAVTVGSIAPNGKLTGNLVLEAPQGDPIVNLVYEAGGLPGQKPTVTVGLT
jgi:hypothetical protein